MKWSDGLPERSKCHVGKMKGKGMEGARKEGREEEPRKTYSISGHRLRGPAPRGRCATSLHATGHTSKPSTTTTRRKSCKWWKECPSPLSKANLPSCCSLLLFLTTRSRRWRSRRRRARATQEFGQAAGKSLGRSENRRPTEEKAPAKCAPKC